MSYRRRMRTSNNGGEDTLEAISGVLTLVGLLLGIFLAPIALYNLFEPQTHTVEPSIPLERAK